MKSHPAVAVADDAPRARLRGLLSEIAETVQCLDALEQAQTRAREQGWHLASQWTEANTALQRVIKDSPRRLAYAFVNNDSELADPVADAKSRVSAIQSEIDRLDGVEDALSSEIATAQAALRDLRIRQYMAMSDIVTASPQYQALLEQHRAAWQHLRSVKEIFRVLMSSLKAQYPQTLADEVQRSEPLEIRVGYPVNSEPERWAAALAALEQSADAALPQV